MPTSPISSETARRLSPEGYEAARSPITSPIALFEAVLTICRKRYASVNEAEQGFGEFLEIAGVGTAPIIDKEAHTALAAFSRYGKGRGHPAQLNLGDSFALRARLRPAQAGSRYRPGRRRSDGAHAIAGSAPPARNCPWSAPPSRPSPGKAAERTTSVFFRDRGHKS
jgi:uncharacterized protein with PIN domain